MNSRDIELLKLAKDTAEAMSKDESRKSGCVFANGFYFVVSGYNDFPRGVARTAERLKRPAKYDFTEHAERNAIYFAAMTGHPLNGCTAYLTWFPCAPCARALVQVGIVRLVCYEPDWSEEQYGFHAAKEILTEGGIQIDYAGRFVDKRG